MVETLKYNFEHKKSVWIILLLILIMVLLLIVTLLTRAFLAPIPEETDLTVISVSNCAVVNFIGEGTPISRTLAYPMNDGDGMLTDPFQFSLTNTCDESVSVNIYMVIPTVPATASRIPVAQMQVSVNESTPTTMSSLTSKTLSAAAQTQFNSQTGLTYEAARILTSVTLPPQSTTYALDYRIRLWIKSTATVASGNKTFVGVIMVADSGA